MCFINKILTNFMPGVCVPWNCAYWQIDANRWHHYTLSVLSFTALILSSNLARYTCRPHSFNHFSVLFLLIKVMKRLKMTSWHIKVFIIVAATPRHSPTSRRESANIPQGWNRSARKVMLGLENNYVSVNFVVHPDSSKQHLYTNARYPAGLLSLSLAQWKYR